MGLSFLVEIILLPNPSSFLVREMIWRCHLLFCVGDSGICRSGVHVPLPRPTLPSLLWTLEVEKGPLSSPPFQLGAPFRSPSALHWHPSPVPRAPRCRSSPAAESTTSLVHESDISSSMFIAFTLCQTLF